MLRFVLLGLLADTPRHGYDLRAAIEEVFGGTWPVNIGQVYSTLARLERDDLVESTVVAQRDHPDRKVYRLTEAGRVELKAWLARPVEEPAKVKDEVFSKVLLHALTGRGDATTFLWDQRAQYLQALAQLTRLEGDEDLHPATRLLLTGIVLHVEADLRWLEMCEERLPELALTAKNDDEGERDDHER